MKNEKLSIKRYSSYKDSGVEWIGEVPEHWRVYHLKSSVSIKITDGPHETPVFTDDGVPFISAEAIQNGGINFDSKRGYISEETDRIYTLKCKPKIEDIFIVKSGSTTGKIGYVSTDVNFNIWSPLALVRVNKINYSRYLFYFLSSSFFQKQVQMYWSFGTQPNIGMKVLENLQVITPLFSEQKTIAHYLDTKTAQCDRKIALLTQKAKLYGNLKQSLINETVTRGLDKTVPMCDRGVEWIGEVPEHWEVRRLKDVIENLESGVSVNATNLPAQNNEKGILKTSCVNKYGFDPNENKTILPEEISRAKCSPCQGKIIISRMNTPELVGASGFVDKDYPNLFLPDRLWQTVFHRNIRINPKWLSYLLLATRLKEVISFSATGSSPSMKNLAQENFLRIEISTPPFTEQKAIAHYLDTKTAQIDKFIQTINTQIDKLKELRKTLINDVVTGKIKVTENL